MYHVYWKSKYQKIIDDIKAERGWWSKSKNLLLKKIGTYFFNYATLNQFLKKWDQNGYPIKINFSKNPPFFCGRPRKWVFPNGNFSILWNMYLKLVTKQARSNLIFSWSKHLINLRITSGSLPFVAGTPFQWRGSENLR